MLDEIIKVFDYSVASYVLWGAGTPRFSEPTNKVIIRLFAVSLGIRAFTHVLRVSESRDEKIQRMKRKINRLY
jgi:hypothetical protein